MCKSSHLRPGARVTGSRQPGRAATSGAPARRPATSAPPDRGGACLRPPPPGSWSLPELCSCRLSRPSTRGAAPGAGAVSRRQLAAGAPGKRLAGAAALATSGRGLVALWLCQMSRHFAGRACRRKCFARGWLCLGHFKTTTGPRTFRPPEPQLRRPDFAGRSPVSHDVAMGRQRPTRSSPTHLISITNGSRSSHCA